MGEQRGGELEFFQVGAMWLAAYLQFQYTNPEMEILPVCPGEPADRLSFMRWFKKEQPDALLATHAAPVLNWFRSLDQKVTRDVGLIELQGNPAAGTAGVYYNPEKIGALAAEMLTDLMDRNETGVPTEPHEITLIGEWREGRTLPGIFASTCR